MRATWYEPALTTGALTACGSADFQFSWEVNWIFARQVSQIRYSPEISLRPRFSHRVFRGFFVVGVSSSKISICTILISFRSPNATNGETDWMRSQLLCFWRRRSMRHFLKCMKLEINMVMFRWSTLGRNSLLRPSAALKTAIKHDHSNKPSNCRKSAATKSNKSECIKQSHFKETSPLPPTRLPWLIIN